MSKQTATANNVRPIDRAKEVVSETVGKTRETVGKTRETVGEQLGNAREKFQEVAGQARERFQEVSASAKRTGDEVKRRAERARKVARERYEVASEQLHEGYGKVRDDVGTVVDDAIDYTRENPGRAILIAAAAGFILGVLCRPRRSYAD